MIYSMTGYGKSEKATGGKLVCIEIKSVNSRYFEYSSRLPRGCAFLDDKIKKYLNEHVTRGKIEVVLTMQDIEASDTVIVANIPLAKSYLAAFDNISTELGIENDITAQVLSRFSDIFSVKKASQDEDALWNSIKEVQACAIDNFKAMRKEEGEKLCNDIMKKLDFIENAVQTVEQTSEERTQKYTQKLLMRLNEVLENTNIDEARILTEAAIFADKTCVDEETVRLKSHLNQFKTILKAGGVVGRKLDFLTQEVNREINTIGSKCNEIAITGLVVEMKSELEKIREQIQNIE